MEATRLDGDSEGWARGMARQKLGPVTTQGQWRKSLCSREVAGYLENPKTVSTPVGV